MGRRKLEADGELSPRKLRNICFVLVSPAPSENNPDDAMTLLFRGVLVFVAAPLPRSVLPPRPRPRPRVVCVVSREVFTSL